MRRLTLTGLLLLIPVACGDRAGRAPNVHHACADAAVPVTCLEEAVQAADLRLEALLDSARAKSAPDTTVILAHDEWETYRGLTCRAEAEPYAGGNGLLLALLSCRLRLADARERELRAWLASPSAGAVTSVTQGAPRRLAEWRARAALLTQSSP